MIEFLKVITLETKQGIFASKYSPLSCSLIPKHNIQKLNKKLINSKKINNQWWSNIYKNDIEIKKIENYIKIKCQDRINNLFLGGSYNPYIRNVPYPPIHININYLIDPKIIKLNSQYNPLYDQHKEGSCENRADPMMIPGIASIPFDPNQIPITTEVSVPWWQLVKDFFKD